jgi:hypothetical protein
MMAVNSSMPKLPRLEIVKVAPVYSSGDSALVLARSIEYLELVVDLNDTLGAAVLHDRGDQTVGLSNSQTNVDTGVILNKIPFPAGVDLLMPLDGLSHKLDHKSVETHLVGQLFIEFGPGIQDVIHPDAEFQVKVGRLEFRLPETLGDHLALTAHCDTFVVESAAAQNIGSKTGTSGSRRGETFYVSFDHSSSRARAGDLGDVVSLLLQRFS